MEYKAFSSCGELKERFIKKFCKGARIPKVAKPLIWLREKDTKDEVLICAFSTVGESCVYLSGEWIQVSKLIDSYEFLDGTPCGMPIGNPNKTDDKKDIKKSKWKNLKVVIRKKPF